jgi:hypothetical protein
LLEISAKKNNVRRRSSRITHSVYRHRGQEILDPQPIKSLPAKPR